MAAFRSAAEAVTQAPLADIGVLGIDETRRGKARWEKDPETGKWSPAADRWHTGFIDAAGHGGLLGQIEGGATGDVLAWLAGTPLAWRQGHPVRGHRHVTVLPGRRAHRPAARHRRS